MKNLKMFEDALLKALLERGLIDREIRSRLLKERVVKKTPILDGVAALPSVTDAQLSEVLATLYGASVATDESALSASDAPLADEIFEAFGVVMGESDDTGVRIYLYEPVFDHVTARLRERIVQPQHPMVVSAATFARISEDIRHGIEHRRHCSISSNDVLNALPEAEVAIRFADELLQKAVETGASDVHIEPLKEGFRVRMRLHGMLQEFGRYDSRFFPSVTSRIKLLCNLDIAERRKTQDGALLYESGTEDKPVETPFRVSVMPLIYGEKVVMRRLSSGGEVILLQQLGMNDAILNQWKQAIRRPHGIILVSGPTGSGKSTTLFAAINEINREEINITTVEGPVEFKIPGVNQVQIDSHKVSFAAALRSILRQDPDVVMLGEIRDQETAEVALRASLTGHMVFSTIHTNDAPSSVTRLIDMGIEPFLVASSVVGVLAQRLVRVLCDACKAPDPLDAATREALGLPEGCQVYTAQGCRKCNGTGFVSRRGVYEFMPVDETVRKLINDHASDARIREYARQTLGMQSIFEAATALMREGVTSYDEVMRVAAE